MLKQFMARVQNTKELSYLCGSYRVQTQGDTLTLLCMDMCMRSCKYLCMNVTIKQYAFWTFNQDEARQQYVHIHTHNIAPFQDYNLNS